ncbi:hypothetical protein AOLI_G00253230 [Acnodon oligacanthus]
MEAGGSQKASPLPRELTRVVVNYNKHAVLLRRNLKETEGFFREMRHNYSNARASASTTAALEAGPLSCISFPRQEEEYLHSIVGSVPLHPGPWAGLPCPLPAPELSAGREAPPPWLGSRRGLWARGRGL